MFDAMLRTRARIDDIAFPRAAGVYALFLARGGSVGGVPAGREGLLYVGTTRSLAQRDALQHFEAGKTGFSTLRRTLGALLKDELSLHAVPRGPGRSPANTNNFRFDGPGEERLSAWMRRCLRLGFATVNDGVASVERGLVRELTPPLNLMGWANPHRRRIKELRAACRAEARDARPVV